MLELTIAPDTVVTLSYVLFDEKGEVLDATPATEPLTYVHGYAQLVPGLELRVQGLRAGERRAFSVGPLEAFGARDEGLIFEVDKDDFPDPTDIRAGDSFTAEGPDGGLLPLRVLRTEKEAILVDMNHPLAGQRVRFEVEIHNVRLATDDEIEQAQVALEDIIAERATLHSDQGRDTHHQDAVPLIQLGRKRTNGAR
jgi:FKBP-type peptidyl-prolyl cis-trans isomerase SlyD